MCGTSCSNCGNICSGSETLVWVNNLKGAAKGDEVILSVKTNICLKATFLVYAVPLIIMFLGVFVMFLCGLKKDVFLLIPLSAAFLWFAVLFILQKKGVFSVFEASITEIREKGDL